MDLRVAAERTLNSVMVNANARVNTLPEPTRDELGNSVAHALWMLHGVKGGYIDGEKGHRWLGYAQGFLVAVGYLDLESSKAANHEA